jgi:hypothetical protein
MFHRARIAIVTALVAGASSTGCATEVTGSSEGDDAGSAATPLDAGAPSVFDSGPAANPYGDPDATAPGGDDGGASEGGTGGGTCQTAADCPGSGKPNDTVTCLSHVCALSCTGEHYDVNGDPSDGCEVADSPLANHQQADAIDVGTFSCQDGASAQNLTGMLPSDVRVHESPTVAGLSATTGAAPDYFVIHASGGACTDDVNLDLQVTGARSPTCFKLTVNTNKNGGQTCATDTTGHCAITNGSSSYGDGSDIVVIVEKTCSSATTDATTYAVTGHL